MGNLLRALVYAVGPAVMAPGKDVTRRAGKGLGPPDGGGVEDDVLLRAVENGGGPVGGLASAAPNGALGDDF